MIGKNAGENGRKVVINSGDDTLPAAVDQGPPVTAAPGETLPGDTGSDETFPEADPAAMNFLVTGADNSTDKSCIELQDKGPRTGERSDTIMIIRLDPATKRSAVLSFPRDLWVKIPGHGTQRINGAYRSDDPQLLIDTIQNEFDVHVDHFIQIDFCAFQRLVKAVGGVSVPLPYPVRDDSTGLEVLTAGLPQLRRRRGSEVRAFAPLRVHGRRRRVARRSVVGSRPNRSTAGLPAAHADSGAEAERAEAEDHHQPVRVVPRRSRDRHWV